MRILIEKKYILLPVVIVCEIYFLKTLASLGDQFRLLESFGLTVGWAKYRIDSRLSKGKTFLSIGHSKGDLARPHRH